MNRMDQREIEQHVTIVGWLLIVGHAIFLAIGIFALVLLVGVGAVSGDPNAWAILSLVGISVAALMTLLAVPGIAAGYGLLKRWSWGRILAIVIAVLGLVNFPIGTAIGVYALWVLLQQAATEYFAAPGAPAAPAAPAAHAAPSGPQSSYR
jgi:hypothetical protein